MRRAVRAPDSRAKASAVRTVAAADAAVDAETAGDAGLLDGGEAESAASDGAATPAPPDNESRDAAPPSGGASGSVSPDSSADEADAGSDIDEPVEERTDAGTSSEPVADGGVTPVADASTASEVTSEPEDDARYVFDQETLRSYNLVVAPEDLATIDANPTAEEWVNGMLEVDGETYGPLGVRYKGSVGGFLPPCTATGPGIAAGPKTGKCSIKVDFDRVDPELNFHGLRKLNFHAMNRDKSMMRDRLGYAMFRESGVAAPRAVHARLSINGIFEGLFVVVEQVDGRFTRSRFNEGGKGNLYKEVWPVSDAPDPYLAALETNEDENPSVDKMLGFAASIREGTDASFSWQDNQYLFNYIAVDRVIANDDGAFHWYCTRNHNYYWYEAEVDNRIWIVPWDLDSSFQNPAGSYVHIVRPWNEPAAMCTCGLAGQLPASCDPLISQWASRPDDYERAVDAFLDGPFAADKVEAKLAAWTAQIDTSVQEAAGLHGAPTYDEWQEHFASLQAILASSREHRGYDYSAPATP